MGLINHSEDLLTRIQELERQVRELRRRTLFNAAISSGGLEVRTPDADVVMRAGQLPDADPDAYGVEMRRRDGTLQARFWDTPGGGGWWALHDEAGTICVSNDSASGRGLATPYLAWNWLPWSEVITPPLTTVNATFEVVARCHAQLQHPRIRLLVIAKTEADTTGEAVLVQGSTIISNVLNIPAAANNYFWLEAVVDGPMFAVGYIDLQARRTAGAGTVRLAIASVAGVQS